MERPMVKAAGITAGAMFIAIGLSAQFGGGHLFGAGHEPTVVSHSASTPPAQSPSSASSPSPRPIIEEDSMSAAGTIYTAWQGGGKKKHGKG
jgi:hypothetical protein